MTERCANCEHQYPHDEEKPVVIDGCVFSLTNHGCRQSLCVCRNYQPDDSARARCHALLDELVDCTAQRSATSVKASELRAAVDQAIINARERSLAAARDARPERGE
jgi:hypothetical protein